MPSLPELLYVHSFFYTIYSRGGQTLSVTDLLWRIKMFRDLHWLDLLLGLHILSIVKLPRKLTSILLVYLISHYQSYTSSF